jgi:hypothetical protein
MRTYIPLKIAISEDDFVVGHKATMLSHLEKELNIPFSLVITSDVFFEFISFNALGEKIRPFIEGELSAIESVVAFSELSKSFETAQFPQSILNQLRECYELICLDTNNLNDLTRNDHHLLVLKRSTNYEDGDGICRGRLFTRNNFEEFIKRVKSIYLSTFTPSSILFRKHKQIKEFSVAIIVSRLPLITTCFEAKYEEDNDKISINSYTGFIDYNLEISRDEFISTIDFLKITNRTIIKQQKVKVYDLEHNMPIVKHYMTMGSAQSASDPVILEIARLAKKTANYTGKEEFELEFVADKHNNLYCLDILEPAYKKEEQTTLTAVEENNEEYNEEQNYDSNKLVNSTDNKNYAENNNNNNQKQINQETSTTIIDNENEKHSELFVSLQNELNEVEDTLDKLFREAKEIIEETTTSNNDDNNKNKNDNSDEDNHVNNDNNEKPNTYDNKYTEEYENNNTEIFTKKINYSENENYQDQELIQEDRVKSFSSSKTTELISTIINFLAEHQLDKVYGHECVMFIRLLEYNPSPNALSKSLELLNKIVSQWN